MPAMIISKDAEFAQKIIDAIKTCYDPEIPVDIWELGLIYEINVDDANDVKIVMTLTSPNCPAAESLPADVETKVKDIPGVNAVKVEISFDPPWEKEMMSEVAQLELGFM